MARRKIDRHFSDQAKMKVFELSKAFFGEWLRVAAKTQLKRQVAPPRQKC
jgi:hypothetical protein